MEFLVPLSEQDSSSSRGAVTVIARGDIVMHRRNIFPDNFKFKLMFSALWTVTKIQRRVSAMSYF